MQTKQIQVLEVITSTALFEKNHVILVPSQKHILPILTLALTLSRSLKLTGGRTVSWPISRKENLYTLPIKADPRDPHF